MSEAILDQLAADMNKLLTEPIGSRRIKITDLTPRDGQQCKLATRVTTDDLLPLCASIDNCGFYAVEVWGGATFDVCMRYLKENPWDRLRRIKAVMPKTKLQMLLRGQHILAYRPYTDTIVCKFVDRAIANGMNVFRIFEATNDFRNIEVATRAVKELGGEAHVEVNYTVSPVHTLEKWMEYAEQLIEIGADWLSLKDATGIMTPFDSYRIIKGIKDRAKGKLPVLLHCHDMGGTSSMCHLMAILAGVDMIDTVLSPLSFGSAHPATETMVASLKGTPFDTGIDVKVLEEPAQITRQIKEKYEKYETGYTGVSADVFIHKVPGGMISNMVAQLKEAKRMDLMEAAVQDRHEGNERLRERQVRPSAWSSEQRLDQEDYERQRTRLFHSLRRASRPGGLGQSNQGSRSAGEKRRRSSFGRVVSDAGKRISHTTRKRWARTGNGLGNLLA